MLALSPLTSTLVILSTTLSYALPLSQSHGLDPRAGGPGFSPIGPDCHVTYPFANNSAGLMPSPTFTNSQSVYSAYFSTPQYTKSQQAQNCFEQCHGFQGCVAALLADQVPTPKGYYGTDGGDLETACLFFNKTLCKEDMVAAPQGQYQGEMAANIQCPE